MSLGMEGEPSIAEPPTPLHSERNSNPDGIQLSMSVTSGACCVLQIHRLIVRCTTIVLSNVFTICAVVSKVHSLLSAVHTLYNVPYL
jgi:hypothetical protein